MKGRKPTPTALKELRGNPGKRPLPEGEPKPARLGTIPNAPRHLNRDGQKEWRRIAAELERLGLLTMLDLAALAAYCAAFGRWVEAEREVKKSGFTIKTTNGNVIQNPALSIANKAMDQMVKIMAEFGMTPSSRTRVTAAERPAPSLHEILQAANRFDRAAGD